MSADLPNFADLASRSSSSDFAADSMPGWTGLATLFGAPLWNPEAEPDAGGWVVSGAPFDATSSSRPGAAEGPRAVRAASLIYAHGLTSWRARDMLDMRTMERFQYRVPKVADAGDCHIYPTNTVKTFASVAARVRELLDRSGRALLLQGDHSMTFPSFAGFKAARPGRRIGFINIDHHFDFGEWSDIHGALYHGSNSRRISELPGMRADDIAFVGVGDVTKAEQYDWLRRQGFHVVPASALRGGQATTALAALVTALRETCDCVYVSVDIDVLDAGVAPGTGNVTIGGLGSGDLVDAVLALRRLPIEVLDVAEVAPRYDPGGRSAQMAARLIFEFLFRHYPSDEE